MGCIYLYGFLPLRLPPRPGPLPVISTDGFTWFMQVSRVSCDTSYQYNDRWVWAPPHPLAHGYQNTRTDETLTPQELQGRRSSDDQQGAGRRGWPGSWLVAAAASGAPAMLSHELSSPPTKCSGRRPVWSWPGGSEARGAGSGDPNSSPPWPGGSEARGEGSGDPNSSPPKCTWLGLWLGSPSELG